MICTWSVRMMHLIPWWLKVKNRRSAVSVLYVLRAITQLLDLVTWKGKKLKRNLTFYQKKKSSSHQLWKSPQSGAHLHNESMMCVSESWQSGQCSAHWNTQRLEHRWSMCPWKYRLDYNISLMDSNSNPIVSHGGESANNLRRNNGLFFTRNQQPVGGFICTINMPTGLWNAFIDVLCWRLRLWLKQLLMRICFVIVVLRWCSPWNMMSASRQIV